MSITLSTVEPCPAPGQRDFRFEALSRAEVDKLFESITEEDAGRDIHTDSDIMFPQLGGSCDHFAPNPLEVLPIFQDEERTSDQSKSEFFSPVEPTMELNIEELFENLEEDFYLAKEEVSPDEECFNIRINNFSTDSKSDECMDDSNPVIVVMSGDSDEEVDLTKEEEVLHDEKRCNIRINKMSTFPKSDDCMENSHPGIVTVVVPSDSDEEDEESCIDISDYSNPMAVILG